MLNTTRPAERTSNQVSAQQLDQKAIGPKWLIWSGRSLHLSSMGSGDMGKKSMTATAAPSDSASARTD